MNNLISNYTGFDGRLNRQRWWIAAIILAVVQVIVTWIVGMIIPGGSVSPGAAFDPAALTGMMQRIGWQGLILGIIFAYPWLAITIKRRHDRNNNGYDAVGFVVVELLYYLLMGLGLLGGVLASLAGLIFGVYAIYILIVAGFLKGTTGPNNYGADPLQG